MEEVLDQVVAANLLVRPEVPLHRRSDQPGVPETLEVPEMMVCVDGGVDDRNPPTGRGARRPISRAPRSIVKL
jgi:hypothetical protein